MTSEYVCGNRLVRSLMTAATVVLLGLNVSARDDERVNRSRNGLGLKGYDPVVYFMEARAAQGSASFEYQYQATRYRFVNAANRDLFAANPGRYVPQYGGFCAYAVSRGYTADIDPEAWAVVDGKLYLNYSKRVRGLWQEDVQGNIRKADANWPELRKTNK